MKIIIFIALKGQNMGNKKEKRSVCSGLYTKIIIEPFFSEVNDPIPNNILQIENLIPGISTTLIDTIKKKLEYNLNNLAISMINFLYNKS